jgi:hypothetical protein
VVLRPTSAAQSPAEIFCHLTTTWTWMPSVLARIAAGTSAARANRAVLRPPELPGPTAVTDALVLEDVTIPQPPQFHSAIMTSTTDSATISQARTASPRRGRPGPRCGPSRDDPESGS